MQNNFLKLAPFQHIQSILGLISGIVGTSVVLFSGWDSIPGWGRDLILFFVTIVTLIYIIVPVQRWAKETRELIKETMWQRRMLLELARLLQDGRFLFEQNSTCSLTNYLDSISNGLVQDQALYPVVKRLAERFHILGDWQRSLLTFANIGFSDRPPFVQTVHGILMLYHNAAEIVRELANVKLPENDSLGIYKDQERMSKEKYNQYMGDVERLLEKIARKLPELKTGAFARF